MLSRDKTLSYKHLLSEVTCKGKIYEIDSTLTLQTRVNESRTVMSKQTEVLDYVFFNKKKWRNFN
jgi:hypothetical protein